MSLGDPRRLKNLLLLLAILSAHSEYFENADSQLLLVSFGENCDEAVGAERVLSSLFEKTQRLRQANSTHEETALVRESVEDYTSYSRRVFSIEGTQLEGTSRAGKQGQSSAREAQRSSNDERTALLAYSIVRCSISHTVLKLVRLSVISLDACPSVDPLLLKEAFHEDSCVDSVEFDSVVALNASMDDAQEHEEEQQQKAPIAEYWQDLISIRETTEIGMCRREVVVAIIDSGIAYEHPALRPNMWTNAKEVPDNGIDDDQNGYIDDVHGYNFADRNANPTDLLGHGTHVAGIIGAVPGHTRACGICEEISLAALRFMDKDGAGTISHAVEALNYAVQMGFQISCNSWGGPSSSPVLRRAILQAQKADHLFITAAGNKGLNVSFLPEFPAAYNLPNIISVAASDSHDRLARFSNYGSSVVHLAAPGVNIHSTFPPETSARLSGTSMAAPFVAAVSALLLSVKPSPVESVRRAILFSVDKIPGLASRVKTGGRLNALKALRMFLRQEPPSTPTPSSATVPASKRMKSPLLDWLIKFFHLENTELPFPK